MRISLYPVVPSSEQNYSVTIKWIGHRHLYLWIGFIYTDENTAKPSLKLSARMYLQ
jgi:hypothetical protein